MKRVDRGTEGNAVLFPICDDNILWNFTESNIWSDI
jgi:hypothetical protein